MLSSELEVTMSSNSSNGSASRTSVENDGLIRRLITGMTASEFIAFFLVLFINTWLLSCILSSNTLRSRLRNQLICSVSILYLLEAVFLMTFEIHYYLSFLHRLSWLRGCAIWDYMHNMDMICRIIPDLLIVLLAFVFLAQVLDFDPASKLSPRYLRIGHVTLLVLPWVFASIVSPLALLGIAHIGFPCVYADYKRIHILESVFTIFPLCLAALTIGLAGIFRCTRFGKGNITAHGNMGVQLMGSGPQIDSSLAYGAAWIVSVASEICYQILFFSLGNGYRLGLVYNVVSFCIESYRGVFLPLTFLFLTDIRQRVKVWRPWRRDTGPSGIDLTVAYNREQ